VASIRGLRLRLSRAAELVDRIEPDRHLQVEALALACHLDHPVYDCLYLAMARWEDCCHEASERNSWSGPEELATMLVDGPDTQGSA